MDIRVNECDIIGFWYSFKNIFEWALNVHVNLIIYFWYDPWYFFIGILNTWILSWVDIYCMQTGSLRILTTFHPFIPLALNSNKQAGPPALNITYFYFKIKSVAQRQKQRQRKKKTKTLKKNFHFLVPKKKVSGKNIQLHFLLALKVFLKDLWHDNHALGWVEKSKNARNLIG